MRVHTHTHTHTLPKLGVKLSGREPFPCSPIRPDVVVTARVWTVSCQMSPDGEADVEDSLGPVSHTGRLRPGALLGIAS